MIAGRPDLGERHQRLADGVLLVALAAVLLARRPFQLEGGKPPLAVAGMQVLGLDRRDLGEVPLAVRLLQRRGVGEARLRRLEPDLRHRLAEELAVLGLVDRLGVRADHLDAELVEHAHLLERQRGVERRLAAHGRQEGVRDAPSR